MIGLLKETDWNEFLELNQMVFDAVLPRNSGSRALSFSLHLDDDVVTENDFSFGLCKLENWESMPVQC